MRAAAARALAVATVLLAASPQTLAEWDCAQGPGAEPWRCSGRSVQPTPGASAGRAPAAAVAPTQAPAAQAPQDPAWALCGTHYPPSPAPTAAAVPAGEEAPIAITADSAELLKEGVSTLSGDVQVEQGQRRVSASQAHYRSETQWIEAEGQVRYAEPGLVVRSERGQFSLDQNAGQVENATYEFHPRHARGEAKQVVLTPEQLVRLNEASYTTCDPGRDDWKLRAKQVDLDRKSGRGTARGVTVEIQNKPILYWPYLSFPIDDRRQSGFLTPTLGSSDASGLDFSAPYYWNIAPNYDATLTPRLISKRGVQLQGLFRYLTERNAGELGLEALPGDREYGAGREHVTLRNSGNLGAGWRTDIDFNYVSDERYFRDLGNSLNLSSVTQLQRRADLSYANALGSFLGRWQYFQTLDETLADAERPYHRVPQLLVRSHERGGPYGLRYVAVGELVHFERSDSVTGTRLGLQPEMALPLRWAAGELTPRVKLLLSQYQLNGTEPGQTTEITRTLPVVSLDGAVAFEAQRRWMGLPLTQTLEPRLYYLYVPYRDQREIPLFDSAALDFGFASMFHDNRFSGSDRIGDANQVTVAVTSRLLEEQTGAERARAGLGRVFYLRDREVQLNPTDPVETSATSDFIGELDYRLHQDWYARAALQWDPDAGDTHRRVAQLHYQPDARRIVNLSYRQREDTVEPLEQTDASLLWPVGRNWGVVARWNYSLADDLTLDAFAGLEYASCCWAVRALGRQYVNGPGEKSNNGFYVQVELKGLTQIGHSLTTLLEQGIWGYSAQADTLP